MSALVVQLSRRVSRQLELGKGMFFDAAALDALAECGAWDHVHKAAGEYQRDEAAKRRVEREEREAERSPNRRGATPGERRTFSRGQDPGLRLVAPGEDVSELSQQVRRMLEPTRR